MAKYKVLLVEDESDVAFVLKFMIEKSSYDCEIAEDGKLALEKFNTYKPDIVLLDIMLPDMSGFEILKMMKETNEKIPVILLTALTSNEDRETAKKSGADEYLTKPVEHQKLTEILDQFLSS